MKHIPKLYLRGALTEEDEIAFEEHLLECATCRHEVAEAVDPIKALIHRFRDEVIPRIEQQRDPSQRKAMLARLEEDLRGAFKVLDDLDNDLQDTRRRCTELFKAARKLRPRGKPRPRSRKRKLALRRPRLIPTDEQKEVVLDALRKRGSVAMSELCHATGFGMAKLKRILGVLREEGRVERSGATSGTRYRARGKGSNG